MNGNTQLNAVTPDAGEYVLFSKAENDALDERCFTKKSRGMDVTYVNCRVRRKAVQLKPEERNRQLWLSHLIDKLGYDLSRIKVEHPIIFGRDTKSKRADIVVFDKDRPKTAYIIVEVKQKKYRDGKEQLRSYVNATGAPLAVWSDGILAEVWHRQKPNYFTSIHELPHADQTIEQVVAQPWTIDTLISHENERMMEGKFARSLRDLIKDMENEVLANAGVDVFEEVFKLIFAKLYDEMRSHRDRRATLRFRNQNTAAQLHEAIQNLFDDAKERWDGVFPEDGRILLSPEHLQVCVGSLEEWKLFNSNLDVIDDAFEYLVSKSSKGEKGQFFTPRWVIDMCVKMMNPQEGETMIDTACGSSGFPVHGMFHVWRGILKDMGQTGSHLFTMEEKPARCIDYVRKKVFAIDFDERSVRVSRCLNLIAGDGETNVLHLNTLDFTKWDETAKPDAWRDTYGKGWKRLRKQMERSRDFRTFTFDVLMANPPFAGDIRQSEMLAPYALAVKPNGKPETKVARDLLFVERNLDFLKPGGRMAIILPQGRFSNKSDRYLREFIMERCRILAVVGLHPNTFKPHTGIRTGVLFEQKWNDDDEAGPLCPKVDTYKIFCARQQVESVDNSGRKVYRKTPAGIPLRDTHGHFVVDHDLFNHDGRTEDGIAEAFEAFARREGMGFHQEPLIDQGGSERFVGGMDASILNMSEVRASNPNLRLDAWYFTPVKRMAQQSLVASSGRPLSELANRICDRWEPGRANPTTSVRNYDVNDALEPMLDAGREPVSVVGIGSTKIMIGDGDVVISRLNSHLKEIAVARSDDGTPMVGSSEFIVLRPKDGAISPETLMLFLRTAPVQTILKWCQSGSSHPRFDERDLLSIPVPGAVVDMSSDVADLVREAFAARRRSVELLDTAGRAVEIAISDGKDAAARHLDNRKGRK